MNNYSSISGDYCEWRNYHTDRCEKFFSIPLTSDPKTRKRHMAITPKLEKCSGKKPRRLDSLPSQLTIVYLI